MKDIIVFIPSDIDAPLRNQIAAFLLRDNIQITYNINEANVIITKENIEKTLDKLITKPFELHAYPIELPIIQKVKIKHFVQKNIDIKRFNKVKYAHNKVILNRKRCK